MNESPAQNSKRLPNGRFAEGASGNVKGRPRKDRRITHPETVRDQLTDVAEFAIAANINGKRHKMSLLQSNLLTLGLAGAAGDKAAARSFVSIAVQMSEQELGEMARLSKHLKGVTPAYLLESDPKRRAELQNAWRRAVADATGEREKTTNGLGKTKAHRRAD